MLRDIAVARVKQMLGFKQNLDAEIVQAMLEVQDQIEVEPELPWFLRFVDDTLVTVIDNHQLAVPASFIRDAEEDFRVTDAEGESSSLVRDTKGYLSIRYQDMNGIEEGVPKKYALINRVWWFYPRPDAAYVLSNTYYKKDDTLATNIENKWLKYLPEILIARSGLMIAGALRDPKGIELFNGLNSFATAKLHQMTTADDQAGKKPVIGGED